MMERTLATLLTMPDNRDVVVILTDSDGMPESPPLWASSIDNALDIIEKLARTSLLMVTPLDAPGQYSVTMLVDER